MTEVSTNLSESICCDGTRQPKDVTCACERVMSAGNRYWSRRVEFQIARNVDGLARIAAKERKRNNGTV